ncbi:uncharacterized protein LY89DRAFT_654081 [Mollisia scopiformis]|uniref:Uncharacterized protein n=1 Tax=Mollisia scopiformis TaxID=149040 RepID=A0A194WU26_MOLSC|nr:uncharacterized protein LY89DRAFT_654081 [Mollisia scopiformis]KUJ11460.1 hypothetical protein LY89DRAFT_654081 [Mollisia scopiformis]
MQVKEGQVYEVKPSCGRCKKNPLACSYLDVPGTSSDLDTGATSSTSSQVSDFRIGRFSRETSKSPRVSIPELHQEISTPLFGVKELELLHFYTGTTCFTVSTIPERHLLWQQVVPRIAFTHHFLLHGIMAFSAMHLARLQPDRVASLHAEASMHHDIGLRMFQSTMLDLSPQNCDACFAYSSIIVVYTWASSDQTADLFFSDKAITGERLTVGWSSLLRGVQTLLNTAGEWIARGSLGVMLYSFAMDRELAKQISPDVTSKLSSLSSLWTASSARFSEVEVAAFNETLGLLHEGYGLVISSSSEWLVDLISIALGWPIRVPEAFLAMVTALVPEALVVLAHYSLLLNPVDHIWYMHGMRRHLLQTIHCRVGARWEHWILWLL